MTAKPHVPLSPFFLAVATAALSLGFLLGLGGCMQTSDISSNGRRNTPPPPNPTITPNGAHLLASDKILVQSADADANQVLLIGLPGAAKVSAGVLEVCAHNKSNGSAANSEICFPVRADGSVRGLLAGAKTGHSIVLRAQTMTLAESLPVTKNVISFRPQVPNGISTLKLTDLGLFIGTAADGLYLVRSSRLGSASPVFERFSLADGLPSNEIVALAYEGNGRLWVATRYNGVALLEFPATGAVQARAFGLDDGLSSLSMTGLAIDAGGGVFLSTGGGGLNHLSLEADGTPTIAVVSTSEGLPTDFPLAVASDAPGSAWVATYGNGLVHVVMGAGAPGVTAYTTADGLSSDYIFTLEAASDGGLWLGLFRALNYVQLTNGVLTRVDRVTNVAGDIRALADDGSGGVWAAPQSGGTVHHVTFNAFRVASVGTFNTAHGLPNEYIRALASDANGDLFLGTDGNAGLFRLSGAQATSLSPTEMPIWKSLSAVISDGASGLWLGGSNDAGFGHLQLDSQGRPTMSSFRPTDSGMAYDNVFSLHLRNGNELWVGTEFGLAAYDLDAAGPLFRSSHFAPEGLPSNRIQVLMGELNGGIWVGSDWGPGRVVFDADDVPSFEHYIPPPTIQDPRDNVVAMTEDSDGSVWFVNSEDDLTHVIPVDASNGVVSRFTIVDESMSSPGFTSIFLDFARRLWFGSQVGLSQMEPNPVRSYGVEDGLSGDWVNVMQSDGEGGFWLGTKTGLTHVTHGSLGELIFTNYGKADGLPGNDVRHLVVESANQVWVDTDQGMVLFLE